MLLRVPGLGVQGGRPPAAGAPRAPAAQRRPEAAARAARQGAALRRARRSPPRPALDDRAAPTSATPGTAPATALQRGRPRCSTQPATSPDPSALSSPPWRERRRSLADGAGTGGSPRTRAHVTLASATDFAGFRAPAASCGPRRWRPITSAGTAPTTPSSTCSTPTAVATVTAAVGGAAARHRRSACRPRSCRCARASSCTATPTASACSTGCSGGLQVEPALRARSARSRLAARREMAQAVRRDMHKMKAFVRFRAARRRGRRTRRAVARRLVRARAPHRRGEGAVLRAPLHAHALGDPDAGAQRRAGTASGSAFGPGARRDQAPPADAGEKLWLTYYQQHLQSGAAEAGDDAEGDAASATGATCRRRS